MTKPVTILLVIVAAGCGNSDVASGGSGGAAGSGGVAGSSGAGGTAGSSGVSGSGGTDVECVIAADCGYDTVASAWTCNFGTCLEGDGVENPCMVDGECSPDEFCYLDPNFNRDQGVCVPERCREGGDCPLDDGGLIFIDVESQGACIAARASCFSACLTDSDCAEGEYCNGDGPCDSPGYCEDVTWQPCALPINPDGTRDTAAEVCGCDAATYYSECSAHAAGTRIASYSRCP